MVFSGDSSDLVRKLFEQAKQGSPEAIGAFLVQFRPYLLQIAFGELGAELQVKESPSDLVQKSFMEATATFADFQGTDLAAIQAWLRRIVINNVRDVRSHFQTEKRSLNREVGRVDELAAVVPSDVTPPTMALIRQEQFSALKIAFDRIGEESRQLIWLRNRDGKPFAEIAEEMGITEVAARRRWARAIEELRQLTVEKSSEFHPGDRHEP